MNDQDLLARLKQIAEAEDAERLAEKQGLANLAVVVKSQISALVSVLRSKDILTEEDVKAWEHQAEVGQQFLRVLMESNAERENASTAQEAYDATKKGLMAARDLAAMISKRAANDIDDKLRQLDEAWKENNK